MNIRKILFLLAGLLVVVVPGFARMGTSPVFSDEPPSTRLLTEITDEPAWFWMIWWVDAGNISDWTISNTLQGGYFGRHPNDEHCYEGLWAFASIGSSGTYRGRIGEYPKGSNQFYGWAWGLWVGSMYPARIEAGDTNWSPNVSKGGFYSDMGGMSVPEMSDAGGMYDISDRGLYFSDMCIPEGYGFDGEGGQLFAQTGQTPLEYQTTWPFADTSINAYRRAIGMPEIHPDSGDIISHQDTYACAGDWIPSGDAAQIWIRPLGSYDVWGQGIRVEQRTYAWNYEYNRDYIFMNYKIQNMNDFRLDSVYISFFMDNDVASRPDPGTSPGDDGAWDDLIGFDDELNMGYTYDANGAEPGWVTPAGYIGVVFLETPANLGLTGFETWQNGFEIDEDGTDSLKYSYMASRERIVWENPNDVRLLMNCGPIDELQPFNPADPTTELNISLVVMVAYSLDELREKAKTAQIQFENGYFGYAPPPNPQLSVTPGDSMVYLAWSADPENYVDPMSGLETFEGYRVYRSLSGLAETWDLLADYDLMDSSNPDTVTVEHSVGPTTMTISYEGLHRFSELDVIGYTDNKYTITFEILRTDPDTVYTCKVFDTDDNKILPYNTEASTEGGWCEMSSIDGGPKDLPGVDTAEGDVTIVGEPDTEIPLNFEFSTRDDPPLVFKTTSTRTIDADSTITVAIKAKRGGAKYNVAAGAITEIVSDTIPGIISVVNEEAMTGGEDGAMYYEYESGDIMFVDGVQYIIEDGDTTVEGTIPYPQEGEQFVVHTYASEELSGQAGIRHYYIDENVDNGQIYYYSVTSYSRPQPTEGVESLEGGKTGMTYWAIPRSNAMGWQKAWVEPAYRVQGTGHAIVVDSVISPDEVTGDLYEVGFRSEIVTVEEETDTVISHAYFRNVDADSLVKDSFVVRRGELSGPVIDGVLAQVAAVTVDTLDVETQIDPERTEWITRDPVNPTDLDFVVDWPGKGEGLGAVPVAKDFLVTVAPGSRDSRDSLSPITVTYWDTGEPADFWWVDPSNPDAVWYNSKFAIWHPNDDHPLNKAFDISFQDTLLETDIKIDTSETGVVDTTIDTVKTAVLPTAGDQLLVKTLNQTSPDVVYRYQTHVSDIDTTDTTRTLDDIRVVPNPYYVRAEWDKDQYNRLVYFQYLPTVCTIRIFNTAGLLIRTIEHDGTATDLPGYAGSEPWNLLTEEGLDCTSGLYIWQVETEDGEKAWGKFAIVR